MYAVRRSLLLALVAVLLCPAAAAARTSVAEVPIPGGHADVAALSRLGFDLDPIEDIKGGVAQVVLAGDAQRARLTAAFPAARETISDYDAYIAGVLAADRRQRAQRQLGGGSGLPSGRTTYRVPADYTAELDALARDHPGVVRRVDLPRRSVEGRPLQGVEIANGVATASDGRPAFVVIGLHHAREWPSGEIAMEFALDLARGAAGDPRISALLDRVRVFVFPVTNPDGFVVSRGTVAGGPAGLNPLQRKNCAGDQGVPCVARQSVDLNRNYGAYWGGNGASTDPSSDTYRGPGPWSEPESQAVHEFSQRLQITGFQSLHNVAALVLRPPGFRALGLAPDEPALRALGDAMAAATGYDSQYGYELYEVTGATEDWNYAAQNAFGYTIETGGTTFQGPYQTHVIDQYLGAAGSPQAGRGVREALLLAGEQAADVRDHALLTGSAPAGRVLRLRKRFTTATSAICLSDQTDSAGNCTPTGAAQLLDDGLDTTLVVPPSGAFTWHIGASTRPFERKAGRVEAWELTCEDGAGGVLARSDLVIGTGQQATTTPCVPGAGTVVGTPQAPGGAPPPVVRPRSKVRLVVGRVRVSRRALRGRRTVRVGLRLSGGVLRRVGATLRDADRQVVGRGSLRRASRRVRVAVRLRRTPRLGTYRLTVAGTDARGITVRGVARVIVVR